ncbi:MAG: 1-acyl-sn-glycerol-3-phosphate acyltransferase [Bacteroidaceae bacterium]
MINSIVSIEDFEQISPIFKGDKGHKLAKHVMHLFALDKINDLYNRSSIYNGHEFAKSLLKDLRVSYKIGNAERLVALPKGSFITISNHPYGGLDGIMLIDLMVGIRPDYKLMANQILSLIKTLNENFIPVQPKIKNEKDIKAVNINGIRETLMHLHQGHPVGFFPAGAVSDFSIKKGCVRDREWQKNIIKIIKLAKVPVLPIRFFDSNSPLFYFLGLINWRIRLTRMPYEVLNKSKKGQRIGIGKIISVKEQEKYNDPDSFNHFLRNSIYSMPVPKSFVPIDEQEWHKMNLLRNSYQSYS